MTDISIAAELWAVGAGLDAQIEHLRAAAAETAPSYARAAHVVGTVIAAAIEAREQLAEAATELNQAAAEQGMPAVWELVDVVAVFDQALQGTGVPVPSWLTFSALVAAEEAARG